MAIMIKIKTEPKKTINFPLSILNFQFFFIIEYKN
jgi:hypothetical protein